MTFLPFFGCKEVLNVRHAGILDETAALVPHLLRFSPDHRAAARELQNKVAAFSREMTEAFDGVWPAPTEDPETAAVEPPDSWATRMAEREKDRERAIKAIAKPELRAAELWRTRLLDATVAHGCPENG